jgi:peptidoglycan/xylan/chitin deacetylase (PgdA/CDA1 family)
MRIVRCFLLLVALGCSNSGGNGTNGQSVGDGGRGGAAAFSTGGSGGLDASNNGGSDVAAGGASSAAGGNSSATGGFTGIEIGYPLPAAGSPSVLQPSGTPGNMKILNWAGFKGAVTYAFDDANSSQMDNYSALNALGVRMTFYLVTDKITSSNSSSWIQVLNDGHELGNHTVLHLQNATATQIDNATAKIETTFGVRPWTFAAPYGDSSYVTFAQTRFLVNRGVSNALVMPNDKTNPFNLPCYIPPQDGTATTDFNPQIDTAEVGGGWRIVLVHGFTGGTDSAYLPVSINEFVAGVNHAKSLGDLWIDNMVNVAAYWRGQMTLASVAPSTSGNTTVWTWILPDNFPPKKHLRITVDGGTPSQNGQNLAWDSHGYYEMSLDAGSLTLTSG